MNGSESGSSGVHAVEAIDLERLAESCDSIDGVDRDSIELGDRIVVTTVNSVYTINCLGDGTFTVAGGWFDKRELSPAVVRIRGCSFGGSAINRRLVAARGLHIEFDNGVVTTQIRRFVLWRLADSSDPN
ncbi:MAG: hypothetical protein R3338_08635 [Thermoanaerobaculia bacterium]|nr:hypothetical protein [Thermoanaerobaculia bacterium]